MYNLQSRVCCKDLVFLVLLFDTPEWLTVTPSITFEAGNSLKSLQKPIVKSWLSAADLICSLVQDHYDTHFVIQ